MYFLSENDEGDECVAAKELAECVIPKKLEVLSYEFNR